MHKELAGLQLRIAALERNSRFHRRISLSLASAWVLAIVVAARPQATQEKSASVTALRASSFELVDDKGRTRGTWRVEGDTSSSLSLIDAKGHKRFEAAVREDEEVYLHLRDNQGRGRITQAVDRADHPHVLVHDRGNKARVHLAVAHSGAPSLIFIDADGNHSAGLGIHKDGEAWLRPAPAK